MPDFTYTDRDPGDERPEWFPYHAPKAGARSSVSAPSPAHPGGSVCDGRTDGGAPDPGPTRDAIREAIAYRRVQLRQQLARSLVDARLRRILDADPWDSLDPTRITQALAELDQIEAELTQ
jgi:hypothetical protein